MNPALSIDANPSGVNPSVLMCEWGEVRDNLPADDVDGGGRALWATVADVDTVEFMVQAGVS
jgi:hypothetical protein